MIIILIARLTGVFPKPHAWQIKQQTELHEAGAHHTQHIINNMVLLKEHFVALIMCQLATHVANLDNVTINNTHVIAEHRIHITLTQQDRL